MTIAQVGLLITVFIFLAGVIFQSGRLSARVSELERWRLSIRDDFHEVSDNITKLLTEIKALRVLVEERTERRTLTRIE